MSTSAFAIPNTSALDPQTQAFPKLAAEQIDRIRLRGTSLDVWILYDGHASVEGTDLLAHSRLSRHAGTCQFMFPYFYVRCTTLSP